MENERITAINTAATTLFLKQGYTKTQISHIAKAIGVSVGTIYHDFVGKQEIMHFMLKSTLDPDFMNRTFERPITDQLFVGLEDEIIKTFDQSAAEFSKNITQAGETYTFKDLISDAFDLFSQYAVGCLYIEKNYMDCGRLATYYKAYRENFFQTMTTYMKIFMDKGCIRPLKDVDLTTTLIIEILTWWAMDMRYISFETKEIPLEQAKEVCMDNIISAYMR